MDARQLTGSRPLPLSGWGRTAPSVANVATPLSPEAVTELLSTAPSRGVIARGLGRSYGDAAQNGGGLVVKTTNLDASTRSLDIAQGEISVEAGISLERVIETTLPLGFIPPVLPGTSHVSIGGAIAADVHGKNQHNAGTFGAHTLRLKLATPQEVLEVSPNEGADTFWATVGGMGLTGIVTEATIALRPVETAFMMVDTLCTSNLDETFDAMTQRSESGNEYSVAWIDCLASGSSIGRGILTRANHARVQDLSPAHRHDPLAPPVRRRLAIPGFVKTRLLTPSGVKLFNEVWFRNSKPNTGQLVPLNNYFFPLDAIDGWNRLYGRKGFVQYQCVVPLGSEDIIERLLGWTSQTSAGYLGVLKRFGNTTKAPLGFCMDGWTVSIDIPSAHPQAARFLEEIDGRVAAAGGRVYLAKDSRTNPVLLKSMYPRLAEWQSIRGDLDPTGKLRSDLGRRLELI